MWLFSLSSRRIAIIVLFLGLSICSFSQNSVSIGTTSTNPKAVLWLSGTNQGIIIPIVSNKTSVSAGPTEKGMVIFDDSDKKVYFYDGTAWNQVGGSGAAGSQGIAINGNTVQLNSTAGATFGLSNTAPTGKGQLLVWDGTKWDATLAPTTTGQTLSWDNTNGKWTLANASLTLAGDVSGPSNNNTISSTSGNNIVAALNNAATTSKVLPAQLSAGTPNQVLTTSAGNVAVWANLPTATGTVTNIATGTGLTGGPITTTGTIALANTSVAPATYGSTTQIPQITVDAQGRITNASNVTPALAGVAATGFLSAADWNTFNNKLTTETDPTVKAINGLVKSNGTTISAATAGTDYLAPNGNGSALTNLNASNLASGTVPTARIDVGTTANKIVQLDGTGKLPAIDGSQLINLPAGTETDPTVKAINGIVKSNGTTISAATAGTDYQAPLVSGTNIKTINGASVLGTGNITAVTTETDPTVTAINGLVKSNGTTISAATAGTDYLVPNGNGSALTNLNANNISSGTLAITNGGTGANTAPAARTALGLGTLATLNTVGSAEITDASIGVADLNPAAGILTNGSSPNSVGDVVGDFASGLTLQNNAPTGANIANVLNTNGAYNLTTTGTLSTGAATVTGLTIGSSVWPANASGSLTNDGSGNLTWVPSGGSGTVTSITRGAGLVAGPAITTSGTLDVNVGTGANQIVQLDGTGKLPAIDGSQLLNLPAGTETDPTVKAINGIVKSNGTTISAATAGTDYQAPLVSGTNIKTINGASVLGTGNITAVTTETDPTVTAINGLVKSNGTIISAATAGTDYLAPNGNGSALTNLNANNISSGTLAIANGGTGATTAPAARTALGLGTLSTLSTVTSTEITDGTIVDADINGTANINGAKINPTFGAQAVSTTSTLTTGTAGQFVVDATGNITKINNITTSFPANQGAANSVLTNDGAGNLTWTTGSGWSLSGNTLLGGEKIGSTNGNPLPFITNNVERMRIDPSGNVGIGTTAPTQPLHVAGPEGQFLVTPNLSGPGATSLMAQLINTTSKGPQIRFAGAVGGAAFNDIGQDATGNFVIEASDVPLLTLNANGALGVGSTPSFGTSGFVLTSNGSGGAPTWQAVSGTGTVTSVGAGTGLIGGPITTSGSLAVDVGTTANKIVQLDGTGKLPAVDGSQLLNLPAGTETDPTVKAINGLVKSDGTTISAAAAGTDYQSPLVSGTNIKTINGTSILGAGNIIAVTTETDPTVKAINGLVKSDGTTIGAVVSGTDIKTINGTSILGAGNITTLTTVTSADITDGTIVDADINGTANINGAKINPTFGAQAVSTTSTLTTGTAGQFVVDATGNITKINNITTSFPANQGAANSVLTNDGAGNLTWTTGSGWSLSGNTLLGGEKIGSTNGNPLPFITNNVERMRIDPSGNVGIGTITPSSTLDVANSTASGSAGNFVSNNASNGSSTLSAIKTGGTGSAIFAQVNGGSGEGINVNQNGTGNGIASLINNASNGSSSIIGLHNGSGDVITAISTGTGRAGSFTINNSGSTASALVINTNGTGPALEVLAGTTNLSGRLTASNGVTVLGTAATAFGGTASLDLSNFTAGILVADDGGFFDHNDGYVTYNGGIGLRIAGNNGPSSSGNLIVNGAVQITDGTQGLGKVLTSDAAGNASWQAISGTGTVTSVSAGTGLTGGPITSSGTLAVDVGTTANKIVQLDATGKLPAIDGSQLINLPAGTETDPTVKAINGLVKSNGTTISAATAGTDYQVPLVSGTNIKTINGTSVLGAGNITAVTTETDPAVKAINGLVKSDGTTIGAVVSGTDVKTINGTSILGAGNITALTTVTSADITDGTIVDADINGTANINGAKINPAFGAQAVSTTSTLTTGSAGQFVVDATGNITKINNIATSFPATQGAANSVLTNDGAGNLTWATSSGWGLTGNAGTVDGTNAIGTTDNVPLNFIVNNQRAGRIEQNVTANTFLGMQAGNANAGSANSAFGSQSLSSNTTGTGNTGTGASSLFNNTTGSSNTATGRQALQTNTTGSNNSAHGNQTLSSNQTGIENTANGSFSLFSNTTGFSNTASGYSSLQFNSTGSNNTAFGWNSLGTNTSGSNNTALGYNADVSSPALTKATAIGFNAKVATSSSMALGGTGVDAINVGINTTSPTERLDVVGNLKFSGALMPNNLPGTAGQVLTSAGPGLPPTWGNGSGWGLTGNVATNPATQFIGTSDAQDLIFKTNGVERLRINQTAGSNAVVATAIAASGAGQNSYALQGNAINASSLGANVGVYGSSQGGAGAQGVVGEAFGGPTTWGVYGIGYSAAVNSYGVYGNANGSTPTAYGVFAEATAVGNTNYGLFATASGASTNWAAYFSNGNVHITNGLSVGATPGTYGTAGQVLTSAGPGLPPTWSAGSTTTASNGITKTGNDFALGGTLTGGTQINRAGNDIVIGGAGNFSVRPGGFGTEVLYVDGASNKVGIGFGNISPAQSLDVAGGIVVDHFGSNNGTFDASRLLSFGEVSTEGIGSNRTPSQETLDFYTSSIKRMTITKTGNIGIGTDTPLTPLQIGGSLGFVNAGGDDILAHGIYFDGSNFINRSASPNSAILLGDGKAGIYTFPAGAAAGVASSPDMRFNVRPTGVGIQVDNPIETFQVNGATYLNPITAPGVTTDRLYNVAGNLFWNGINISAGGSGWSLNGNAGTVDGTNFIGTTDNVPLSFRVNNQNAGKIDNVGNNVFLGSQSGNSNTGPGNTGIGSFALKLNSTGDANTAIGYNALQANTTASYNTAIGNVALNSNTGFNNTAGGYRALFANTSAGGNTAFGSDALSASTGSNNTAVGYSALITNVAGINNTAIGHSADVTVAGLINATAIGYNAKVSASNSLVLGGTGADAVNVGIGTTTPKSKLQVGSRLALNSASVSTFDGITRNIYINASDAPFYTNAGFANAILMQDGLTELTVFPTGAADAALGSPTTKLSVTSTGVGINNAGPPVAALDVNGQIKISGGTPGLGKVLTSDATGLATWQNAGGSVWGLTGNALSGGEKLGSTNVTPLTLITNNIDRMTIDATGKVGIGTTTPGVKLAVTGIGPVFGTDNSSQLQAKNTVGTYETWLIPRENDNATYMFYGANGFNIRNNSGVNTMFMDNANNVGIGTTNPNGFSGKMVHLSGTGNTAYILEKTDATARKWGMVTGGGGEYIVQDMTGTSNPFIMQPGVVSNQLYLQAGGNVGIGTPSPGVRLDIVGATSLNDPSVTFFNDGNGGSLSVNENQTPNISVRATGGFLSTGTGFGGGFYVTSDERIKRVVGLSDSKSDLSTLMKLKVTDYKFVDSLNTGQAQVKGVLAQEVETVYPQAISKQTNFIPNIYAMATNMVFDETLKTLTVSLSKPHDLKIGDKVKLISNSSGEKSAIVTAIKSNSFTVANWTEKSEKVFVYGKEVNDFRIVDYDRLFTLNISATQELVKLVEEQKKLIDELKAKEEENKKKIAQLETSLNKAATSESELASLKSEIEKIKAALGLSVDAALPKKEEKK